MANQITNVGFQSPGFDYSAELSDIARRQKLADALQAQSMEPIPEQRGGRFAVPINPLQGAAKLANAYTASLAGNRAIQAQAALADKYRSDLSQALVNAQQAAGPHQEPVDTSQQGTGSMDMSGSNGPATQTVPGSREKMIQALMMHPATQPLAMQALGTQLQEGLTAEQLSRIMGGAGTATPAGNPMVPGPSASVMAGSGSSAPQGQAAPAKPSIGGIFDATPEQLSAMLLSSNPQIATAAKAVIEQRKVTALRPNAPGVDQFGNIVTQPTPVPPAGGGIRVGPNGPEVYQLPNAAQVGPAYAGAMTGAQEAARSQYELVPGMTDKEGRPLYRSKASVLGVTPQAQPSAPAASPAPAPQPAPGRAQGGVGQSVAERSAAEANEKLLAEEASKGREAANIAVDTNYNLQHVLQSAQGFDTGKFAPTIMGARSYLQGFAPDLFPPEEMSKLKDFQELNKYSIRLGFDQARKMGARESTQIVQMSIESNPNPQMVGPAIQAIGHGLMAQNDYVIAKEKARDAWQKSHNGTLGGFNSSWQETADPRSFLLKYQTPQEQQKLFSQMSDSEKQKLLRGLQGLRSQGIL